jgi:hypothetical protein
MHSNEPNTALIKNEHLNHDELASIAEEYPYYSLAQFWFLSNYKKTGDTNFEKQASVTALFFNNHNWLNRQLYYTNKNLKDEAPVALSAEPDAKKPVENTESIQPRNEEVIAFEPLHMVDYFASQGIKISEEQITNDKLGTQLKSFTEWLKSMKKLHAGKIIEGDEQTDKVIQHIAEGSNVNIEVVTEAMAEVLLKQGKPEQAIAMYNKLSLKYPARSGYFAAKINSLKSV